MYYCCACGRFSYYFSRSSDEKCESVDTEVGAETSPSGLDAAPKPKRKRLCVYNDAWKSAYPFICSVSQNKSRVYCQLCKREFGVGHSGEGDIKSHITSDSRITAEKDSKQTNLLTKFMSSSRKVVLENEVKAAEICMLYHSLNHCHSYCSLDSQ